MKFTDFTTDRTEHANFMYDTIYFQEPGEKDFDNEDWDENDDDFEDEEFEDEAEDIDDLHEIRVDDDLNEPEKMTSTTLPTPTRKTTICRKKKNSHKYKKGVMLRHSKHEGRPTLTLRVPQGDTHSLQYWRLCQHLSTIHLLPFTSRNLLLP